MFHHIIATEMHSEAPTSKFGGILRTRLHRYIHYYVYTYVISFLVCIGSFSKIKFILSLFQAA